MSREDLDWYWKERDALLVRGSETGDLMRLDEERKQLSALLGHRDPLAERAAKYSSMVILSDLNAQTVSFEGMTRYTADFTQASAIQSELSKHIYDALSAMARVLDQSPPPTPAEH